MLIRIDEKRFVTFSDGHQLGLNWIQRIWKGDSSQIKTKKKTKKSHLDFS